MGGGGWLMTTTVMNVMLMGDDDVDDVADFFVPSLGRLLSFGLPLRDAALSPRRPTRWNTTGCLWRAVPLAQQGHCCQMHWQRLVPCWPALAAPT